MFKIACPFCKQVIQAPTISTLNLEINNHCLAAHNITPEQIQHSFISAQPVIISRGGDTPKTT